MTSPGIPLHESHRCGNHRGVVNDDITEFIYQHIEHAHPMRRWCPHSSLFGGRLMLTWLSCNVYSALKDHEISWTEYPVISISPGEPQLMRACQTRSWMPLRQWPLPPTIKMKPESSKLSNSPCRYPFTQSSRLVALRGEILPQDDSRFGRNLEYHHHPIHETRPTCFLWERRWTSSRSWIWHLARAFSWYGTGLTSQGAYSAEMRPLPALLVPLSVGRLSELTHTSSLQLWLFDFLTCCSSFTWSWWKQVRQVNRISSRLCRSLGHRQSDTKQNISFSRTSDDGEAKVKARITGSCICTPETMQCKKQGIPKVPLIWRLSRR